MAENGDRIVTGSDKGRIGQILVHQAQASPWEPLRTKTDERVYTAAIFSPGDTGLALNPSGLALIFDPEKIPGEGQASTRGIVLRRGFSCTALLDFKTSSQERWSLLTSLGRILHPVLPRGLPLAGKDFSIADLHPGEYYLSQFR